MVGEADGVAQPWTHMVNICLGGALKRASLHELLPFETVQTTPRLILLFYKEHSYRALAGCATSLCCSLTG
jgi:hypothetical protein